MKKQRGITLIALIITIIVLLILAGITINVLTGENGIFSRSTKAVINTYHATVKEQIILGVDQYFIDTKTNKYIDDVIKYLKETDNEFTTEIDSTYDRVNVEKIAKNIKTGKGRTKADGDIYVIEEYTQEGTASTSEPAATNPANVGTVKNYALRYYETSDNFIDLLYLDGKGNVTDPNPELGKLPEGGSGNESEEDEDIILDDEQDEPITEQISYIEDLVDLQIAVAGGANQLNEVYGLTRSLNFTDDDSYREPTSTAYGDLNADGTIESLKTELSKNGFHSIGTQTTPYAGVFNGQEYSISGLSMTVTAEGTEETFSGLFGYISGKIKNLTIENSTFIATNPSAIAYENNGMIQNCEIKQTTLSAKKGKFGGLVYNNGVNGKLNKCATNVDCIYSIESGKYGSKSGAIVAINNGKVNECTNATNINLSSSGGVSLGGIVGENNGIITKCKNKGVLQNDISVAGIVVENNGKVKYCTNESVIQGGSGGVSGIIAKNSSNETIIECTNKGTIAPKDSCSQYYVGGIVGYASNLECKILDCKNEGQIVASHSLGGIIGCSESILTVTGCTNSGMIIPISGQDAGGIVGYAIITDENSKNRIVDCTNIGAINCSSGVYRIGGIVGNIRNAEIQNCHNNATMNIGTSYYGGIAGIIDNGTISGCTNKGSVNGCGYLLYAGGIAGVSGNNSTLIKCNNEADFQNCKESIGGIVGMSEGTDITLCDNFGELNSAVSRTAFVARNIRKGCN